MVLRMRRAHLPNQINLLSCACTVIGQVEMRHKTKLEVELKLFVYLAKHMLWGNGGTVPCILDPCIRWRLMVNFTT